MTPGVRTGGWEAYARALTDLQLARRHELADRAGSARRRAERQARLRDLDAALRAQQAELRALAADLRAPLSPDDLGPLPVPPLDGLAADADAQARLEGAQAAMAEARRVARLPQLMPEWSGTLGRAALVYLGFAVPNVVVVVALSVAGVHGSSAALLWFAVIWPLVTAVAGGVLLGRARAPRLPPDEPSTALAGLRPARRYPWLGVLMAWASWLVPGWLLDQLAALTLG
ncbi:MAG TPA: hypothetical protein VI248_25305 [Kineosporiaceae bacterium]